MRLSIAIPSCSRLFGCSRLFRAVRGYLGAQDYFELLEAIRSCSKLFEVVRSCSKLFERSAIRTYSGPLDYSELFRLARDCSDILRSSRLKLLRFLLMPSKKCLHDALVCALIRNDTSAVRVVYCISAGKKAIVTSFQMSRCDCLFILP